ncbi:alpha/beta hydrolase [Betaproteobacteria bacterium SCN2]|jgi:dienelactone hydrolase|nr:alpha/beta hydrolase [Betaproteobacteria bacterium SCN2]
MRNEVVRIPVDGAHIEGALELPGNPVGLVLFAHGSGSSRHSPRNNYVARVLHEHGIGTLLMDLLTPAEDSDYAKRFDISLLVERLRAAAHWVRQNPATATLPVGYFGASTGAAAALRAAAHEESVAAVVSRGGRPDLASPAELAQVKAPTLLLVGGQDFGVITLNEAAFADLVCEKQLRIVPGATHLFEEPGTLEEVASQAAAWFARHFPNPAGRSFT